MGFTPLVRGEARRLTYAGEDAGEWTATGVWTDESGTSANWEDGAVAVISGKSVSLPSNVLAYGIEYATTGKHCLTGAGKLTLGAGGLSVTSGDGEVNIQNAGGVHLAASQLWTRPDAHMVVLDGGKPLTAATDVTWTIGGKARLRVNCKGTLGTDVTVVFRDNALLSPAKGAGQSLGSPKIVLEGAGAAASFGGSEWDDTVFGGQYASGLTLRSGASLAFGASKFCRFEIPELTVDGDAADSRFTGGLVRLASGQTVFDVADGHVLTLGASLTNAPNAAATVVKRGAGTLTLVQPDEPVDFTVSEGTLKVAFSGYRHYRFKIDGARGSAANGAQISEFKLLDGETAIAGGKASFADGTRLTWASSERDCSPTEAPTNAVDGKLETKWFDWRAGAKRIAAEGDKVWVQLTYDTPVVATGYSWATADDNKPSAVGDNCADPAAWRLLASDDGETWVELDKRENMGPYEERRTWVGEFPVAYPAGRGATAKLGHVVVEEGATLDLDLRGFTSAMAAGVVESRGGTIVTDAGTRTGNSVAVLGGTFARGTSFGGKFFRVTVTGNGGAEQISIAEFSLYAADGARVNQGTFTKVDSPDSLAANQVALTTTGKVNSWGENIDCVFDGDATTKLYVFSLKPTADAPVAFTFRLPEDAARVIGYTFTTAADSATGTQYQRNPTSWKIEGSADGKTWCVLDEKTDASAPRTNCTVYNDGVPYVVTGDADERYPFGEEGVVSVAPGATLDLSSVKLSIKHLSANGDAETAGTITCFTPAPNGTLDLTVADPKSVGEGFVVPLTVGEIAEAANFASWTVRINGKKKKNRQLAHENGKLVIHRGGILLIVR